jgi:ribosome maturation factor RimP
MQHAPSSKSLPFLDRDRLLAVIEPVVRAHGAEVWDIELKNENGWVLRVYVERLGSTASKLSTKNAAIDLELCSAIARDLSPALDIEDPIAGHYNLEVSSPGIERSLRNEADYDRFAGEKAKLKLRSALHGQKVYVGRLGQVGKGSLTLHDGDESIAIPLEQIVTAHLVFEFGNKAKGRTSKRKP